MSTDSQGSDGLKLTDSNMSVKEQKKLGKKLGDLTSALMDGNAIYDKLNLTRGQLDVMYTVGYSLYRRGKFRDALKFFVFLGLVDQNSVVYKKSTAACLQAMGSYNLAIPLYIESARLDQVDPKLPFYMAVCFKNMQEFAAAGRALNMVIQRCGTNPKYELLREKANAFLSGVNAKITQMAKNK